MTRVFAWLPTLTPAEVEAYRQLAKLAGLWRYRACVRGRARR
jgi:alkylated DNA nucleotide flippase Atl1